MKTEMNTVKVRKTEELEAEQLGAHIGEIVRLHGSRWYSACTSRRMPGLHWRN